jgi:Nucleotidyl transferase AbiEii toxin, Type IV TA system
VTSFSSRCQLCDRAVPLSPRAIAPTRQGSFSRELSCFASGWGKHIARPKISTSSATVPLNYHRSPSRFGEVCLVEADDGLVFDLDAIQAERIREDAEYEGVRIRFRAELAAAQIPLQIDVGFGDAITPEPSLTAVPSMLGMDPPQVLAYPLETVVAEKLHAMVSMTRRRETSSIS